MQPRRRGAQLHLLGHEFCKEVLEHVAVGRAGGITTVACVFRTGCSEKDRETKERDDMALKSTHRQPSACATCNSDMATDSVSV